MSPKELELAKQRTQELLDTCFCEPVRVGGQFATNIVIAAKKDENGEWKDVRVCHDYRKLNAVTKPDEHGLPHIDDLFMRIGQAKFITKLDLRSGYMSAIVAPADRCKTAFWCDRILYQFVRMPFGMRSSPAWFQRAVDTCLADHGCTAFAMAYIDDVCIFSDTAEAHLRDLGRVLRALGRARFEGAPQQDGCHG
jgi:hypothetical protein